MHNFGIEFDLRNYGKKLIVSHDIGKGLELIHYLKIYNKLRSSKPLLINIKSEFQKPINPNDFSDKFVLTEKLNTILEEMIKKNPDQWIWTHNRWK